MAVKLGCPDCGSPAQLDTIERAPVAYPARFTVPQVGDTFSREAGDTPAYTGEQAGRVVTDDAEWSGDVRCRACGWFGDVVDLEPPCERPGCEQAQSPREGGYCSTECNITHGLETGVIEPYEGD